jgi:serine-type D-Ala-D-Ala carboxypeptidase/endopeptidase (penicillin-binding protein 4)
VTRLPGNAFRRQELLAGTTVMLLALTACTAIVTSEGPPANEASVSPSHRPAKSTPTLAPTPTETASFTVTRAQSHSPWARAITRTIGGLDVSVAVGVGNRIVYQHLGDQPRVLASNEKLLTSMAALDLLGPSFRFTTEAARSGRIRDGVLDGDVWLIGGGDPALTSVDLAALASDVRAQGVRRVSGDVVADTSAFNRGWWAPGWLKGISRQYVTRPTALRIVGGDATPEPEAAAAFLAALGSAGVVVDGHARVGAAPSDVTTLATDRSPPLHTLLAHQNHESDNLYAELTTKYLGGEHAAASTASGAAVIQRWAHRLGVSSSVRDGSGLSDQDRTSAAGVVTLLLAARREPWGPALEASLPRGGEGTLGSRLAGVPVRAKTGTLFIRPASTLSGYVTSRSGATVAFSVLTHDLPEGTAISIEDTIVRTLAAAEIG